MYKEQYREGDFIIPNYALSDGFRSEGLFADPEYTTPFDFTKPIEGNTNIYIHRSDEFYFSPTMIANRFTCEAAASGAGSTAGFMEVVGEGEDQYVKVNYGYSTAADPFIWLKNVTVDISHSQKIKIVMNELMRKRVERSHNSFFTRYGVKDLAELDALFGKSIDYDDAKKMLDEMNQKYSDLETGHKDLTKRYAYKVGNVNPDKIADIETYFKGKGIDIDENTLAEELKTHPDWVTKTATVQNIGSEVTPVSDMDEKAVASEIFGVSITQEIKNESRRIITNAS